MNSVLLLLSAPSGGGKTTVMQGLLAAIPRMRRVITCTTRSPREGERDGIDYHFLSMEEFVLRRNRDEFLESAEVYGRAYGTLRKSVFSELEADRDVVLSLDVQGAESVRQLARRDPVLQHHLVTIFITPPTREELSHRLRGRGSESPSDLERRLATADAEVAEWNKFDYLIVSGSRESDLHRIKSIYEAEHSRARRQAFQWKS